MRLNPHAIIGIPLIAGMIWSVAAQWGSPNWWNIFVFASICVIVYSITVITLQMAEDKSSTNEIQRGLLGIHLTLVFWIVGTRLPLAHSEGSAPFLILYFFVSLLVGIGCSRLLLRSTGRLNPHAIIGIPLLAVMAWSVVAQWGSPNWWNIFVFASICVIVYGIAVIILANYEGYYTRGLMDIALAFWIVGTWLPPAHNETSILFLILYFFVSLSAGIGCSYRVLRRYPPAIFGIPLLAVMAWSVAAQWGSPNWWNIFVFASICIIVYGIMLVPALTDENPLPDLDDGGNLLGWAFWIFEARGLLGIHLALAFWIVGTWLPPAHSEGSVFFLIVYFLASLLVGIGCSFLSRDPHTLIASALIAGMALGVVVQWGSSNWWNIFVFASVCVVVYSITVPILQSAKNEAKSSATEMQKGLLGVHLASAFWIVGTWLPPAHSEGNILFLIFYFFVSLLVGLGCPFLVLGKTL